MRTIVHCITSLDTGGAENALHRLVSRFPSVAPGWESRVVCLLRPGPVAARIRALGVPVESLGMTRGMPSLGAMWRLVRLVRAWRPAILQTWLYHADLMGLAAAKMAGVPCVAWNLRCSRMDLEHYGRLTRLVRGACARLSPVPAAVLANSTAARDYHAGLGYRPRRFEVIPNGFDTGAFWPDPRARAALRARVGAGEHDILVGLAARWDHMKGHEVFCRAAGAALQRNPHLRFVLCGDGIAPDNDALMAHVRGAGLEAAATLLGRVDAMAGFYPGLDVACLSSHGESFPNVVGEAMACGVPCVCTNAGDAAAIVGKTGIVAPVGDYAALAQGMLDMAGMAAPAREALGRAARERVVAAYSLDAMAARYAALYNELAPEGA
ncbi:MAG: glycosyltransferase [Desulfovibrionaceae bacterium]